MKLRVRVPSPQISISPVPCSLASITLRRLLSAAVPGSMGPVHIVESCEGGLEAKVLAEVATHALGEELLPAIAILWHGRVGVDLAEGLDVGMALLVSVIDTGGGGIEKASNNRWHHLWRQSILNSVACYHHD